MKPFLYFVLVVTSGTMLYACKRDNNNVVVKKRVVDLIAGAHVWRGVYQFDTAYSTINSFIDSIIILNDSTVELENSNIPLTYLSTDSSTAQITFGFRNAPPTLYYYYKGDSLHFMNHSQGVHLEYVDWYSP